jgi:hypothetical protein
MFDKVSRFAERTADGLLRREFFGHLGRFGLGAMAAALFVGAAAADHRPRVTVISCVLNGGCCGGGLAPYLLTFSDGTHRCTSNCTYTGGVLCANSTCCGGRGGCYLGVNCYADDSCNVRC